jgi:hypothetical protein
MQSQKIRLGDLLAVLIKLLRLRRYGHIEWMNNERMPNSDSQKWKEQERDGPMKLKRI